MSKNSLKGTHYLNFDEQYRANKEAFFVLLGLYASRAAAKQRFLIYKKKQRFRATFINDAVRKMEERAGGKDFVVAYGDGSFPVSMKGMIGGGGCHRSLMILLSKRVRVVMTDEHRTTHACPALPRKCQREKDDSPEKEWVLLQLLQWSGSKNGNQESFSLHSV